MSLRQSAAGRAVGCNGQVRFGEFLTQSLRHRSRTWHQIHFAQMVARALVQPHLAAVQGEDVVPSADCRIRSSGFRWKLSATIARSGTGRASGYTLKKPGAPSTAIPSSV